MSFSFSEEPAVLIAGIGGVIEAVVVLAISFGAPIDPDQKGAISALVTVVLTLATGVLIRGQVTPVAKLAAVRGPDAAPPATPAPPAA